MQTKTTMRCDYTPSRMANIKIATTPSAGEDAETLTQCRWEREVAQPFWKRVQPFNPGTALLDIICPAEMKTSINAEAQTRMFGAGEIGTITNQNQPSCPSADDCFHPPVVRFYHGLLLGDKKEAPLTHGAIWMTLQRGLLSGGKKKKKPVPKRRKGVWPQGSPAVTEMVCVLTVSTSISWF